MLEFKIGYKTFKVNVDLDALIQQAIEYRANDFQDSMDMDTEKPVTEEEFKDDVQALINYLMTLKTMPSLMEQVVVEKVAKKKDGWFAKGRVSVLYRCDKTAYISEEEYGYRVFCLRAKSSSADTVDITLMTDIFKW